MTGTELYELNTEIRGGRQMDTVIFFTLLNQEKRRIEQKRKWRKLVTLDATQSTAISDTVATPHTLPARFLQFASDRNKIKLVNGSDVVTLEEIPYEQLQDKATTPGYFAINHATGLYYLTGSYSKTYTHYIYFCQSQAAITANDEWTLGGDDFGPILAFAVAVIDESGMDYDEINAKQATGNSVTASTIERTMNKWDDQLQRSALNV